ncbi:MAG: STAS domain-containing protein [Victivallales bacterium]|nr:STAS domain-containing protein [Victivallales bacterium]
MEYQFEKIGDVMKVTLDGRLVAACSDEFREKVLAPLTDNKNFLIDMEKVSHVDSSGLGALVVFQQRATAEGGTVKLAALQKRPRIVFDITKVYRVFEIYETVEEALTSFKQADNG